MTEEDPVVTRRLSERMLSEAIRLANTIEDLLVLSRIESEEAPDRDVVAVHKIVSEAVNRIRPGAESTGIAIEVPPPDLRLGIHGDRRQIVSALCVPGFDGFEVGTVTPLPAATMTQYDQTFPIPQAFPPFSMARILAEVLSVVGKTQFRTAETEKYPHVTYFFNGGHEPPWPGEERELVASQKVATYDLAPEMSAAGITDVLTRAIARGDHDFYLVNFANADMVGHTGVIPAVIRAVETVDAALGRILPVAERAGARLLVTADHGNAEMMIDPESGGPHTAHTTNPVPFLTVGEGVGGLRAGGALCDVAPTILALLGLEQPAEMTGRSLLL
jgi:2,3-bisphosphoglycerate-independent phosphoglycerate mutase